MLDHPSTGDRRYNFDYQHPNGWVYPECLVCVWCTQWRAGVGWGWGEKSQGTMREYSEKEQSGNPPVSQICSCTHAVTM